MASLIDLVKRREPLVFVRITRRLFCLTFFLIGFLDAIRSVNKGQWKILVVDDHSQRLIGATLKTYDILEENVTRQLTARLIHQLQVEG